MPDVTLETEQQPKESFVAKYGAAMFWGTLIAMPVMNAVAAGFNYKNIQTQLEIAKIAEATAQK